MARRMLIDATYAGETRVAVVDGQRLEDFDLEIASKKQLKGGIFLAKVTRVEPSLQAAFLEYGGNRQAFLAFPEIHQDYYRIPVADQPVMGFDAPPAAAAQAGQSTINDDAGLDVIPDFSAPQPDDVEYAGDADFAARDHDTAADFSPAHDETPIVSNWGHLASNADVLSQNSNISENLHVSKIDHILSHVAPELLTIGQTTDQPSDAGLETLGEDDLDEARHQRRRLMRNYRIQEVIKRNQVMLVQVVKEERGTKGAAVTSYISLPGRYCVLMPNSPHGGGVSRKITNQADRRRMKEILSQLSIPDGMAVILRTAGLERPIDDIRRDLDYLLRLWDQIREVTLQSSAPALVYEESDLVRRAIRDLYNDSIDEIIVAGSAAYESARAFMGTLMPSHVDKIKAYTDPTPLFFRHNVEAQIDAIHHPTVQLRSGGYIIINQTEALVAVDVNSGKSTRERNIEETALRTNLEAADEVARQLRLRDMAGLIVIDFIDMEEGRNRMMVERRMKEAMRNDRARIQIGRISPFGLLELSRQRLNPSIQETHFLPCPACHGTGSVRAPEASAQVALRALEEEGLKRRTGDITLYVPSPVALFMLNERRTSILSIEQRYDVAVMVKGDDALIAPAFRLERAAGSSVAAERTYISHNRTSDSPTMPLENSTWTGSEKYHVDLHTDMRGAVDANISDAPQPQRGNRRRRGGNANGNNGGGRGRDNKPFGATPSFADQQPMVAADAFAMNGTDYQPAFAPQVTAPMQAGDDQSTQADAASNGRNPRGRRGGRNRRNHDGAYRPNGAYTPVGEPGAPQPDLPAHASFVPVQQAAQTPSSVVDFAPTNATTRTPAPQTSHDANHANHDAASKRGWWQKLLEG